MTTSVRTPASDIVPRIVVEPPSGSELHVLPRVAAGAGLGATIGAIVALAHAGGNGGAMLLVELEFLATGFAMIGALFALVAATPSMHGWGEDSARG